jgi:hypothetical protein
MYLRLFFLFTFFIASIPAVAQNSPSHRDGNVYLTVTVTDGNSYPITGLIAGSVHGIGKEGPIEDQLF